MTGRARRAEVDHVAGREQLGGGAGEVAGLPRVGGEQDAAAPVARCAERGRPRAAGAGMPVALSCATRSCATESQCSGKCGCSSGV